MELYFAMMRGDRMIVPGGGPKAVPTISPVDLGEIVAQAVVRDDLSKRRIRLAGPEPLSFPEAAKRLSAVYGRTIRFTAIPLVFPKIAWYATWPVARLSGSLCYVHTMLGFVQLLNEFPQDLALASVDDHRDLVIGSDVIGPNTCGMSAVWQPKTVQSADVANLMRVAGLAPGRERSCGSMHPMWRCGVVGRLTFHRWLRIL
jgi:hypothetical protein